jgi:hypothetical protein
MFNIEHFLWLVFGALVVIPVLFAGITVPKLLAGWIVSRFNPEYVRAIINTYR